jgi:uncharacterized protein YggU (UPF0235/DUF167 family)
MIRIVVRAQPGARTESLCLLPDGSLDARVRAPPLDGRGNAAVLAAVAAAASLRPHQVRLVRGERSRRKLVQIDVADFDELRDRLCAAERKVGR